MLLNDPEGMCVCVCVTEGNTEEIFINSMKKIEIGMKDIVDESIKNVTDKESTA